LCTSTPITIINLTSYSEEGATGERTGLTWDKLPSSYQVTLDGLGKAAATQRWQVGTGRQFGIESAAADPSLSAVPDATVERR
jgi:hypothetical protein